MCTLMNLAQRSEDGQNVQQHCIINTNSVQLAGTEICEYMFPLI